MRIRRFSLALLASVPSGCKLEIFATVVNDFTKPGVTIPAPAKQWLTPDTRHWLYDSEYLSLPPLAPGESVVIPVVLKPNTGSWLLAHPEVQMYWTLEELWYALYHGGTASLIAPGACVQSDSLTTPAEAQPPAGSALSP